MAQELGVIGDEDGVLLFALVQTHDGFGDLADQISAIVRWFEIQLQRELPQQIQGGARSPVQVEDLVEAGVESGGEGAGRGGLTGTDFSGQQTSSVMIDEKL